MGKGILWNGKYYTIPQAGSRIDSSALARVSLGGANKLVIMGEMIGLVLPGAATKVSNPSLAQSLIHPSCEEARLAVQLAFDPAPGSEIQGASEVYLVPVNPAVAASSIFSAALELTTYMFGLPANQIKAKIEAGTTGKKVTIAYLSNTETFDNLTKPAFSIQYTGAGAAVMTINVAAATHMLTTTCTGAPADNLALDLNSFDTIQALVDAINATGKYTAIVLTSTPGSATMQMDSATAVDIKTAAYTAKSDLQMIVDTINKLSGYVSATRVTDAGAIPANADWKFLAGGANGVTTNATWQTAFDLLKTMDIQLILPLSPDPSIHAMADSHAGYMSGPDGKSERRTFVGGELQSWNSESTRRASIDALKAAAKALNSDRTMHVGLGCYQYDPDGKSKLYPAYVTAAMYSGIAAGGSPVLPLTRKYLRCLGLEVELRVSEIEELLDTAAGVAVPITDMVQGAGYVVSRQITTWGQNDDLYRLEFSVGRGADYVAREVRKRHELLIGMPGTEQMDTTIVNLTNAVLEACKRDGYIRNYDPKKTSLRLDGTVRYVDYNAEPILPINWIFSTYYLQPTTFSIGL